MMLLFAQTTSSSQWAAPTGTATWLAVLGFLLFIWNQGAKALRSTKDKPHPGDVQRESAEKYVTKPEFQNHVAKNDKDHDNIFTKMGGVERGAKSAVEQQVEVVRKDVAQCGRDIAGLKVETQLQNQSLARVESKLDRLIERD
jgi:hypothetical protein